MKNQYSERKNHEEHKCEHTKEENYVSIKHNT
jgi:hypothetical protein